MVFAQLTRKEWEQVVDMSDRRRAAWQRRSSKVTFLILRSGKPKPGVTS